VRLTRTNGSHVEIDHPQIAAGAPLTGIHNTVLSRVAISDVTQVATPEGQCWKNDRAIRAFPRSL